MVETNASGGDVKPTPSTPAFAEDRSDQTDGLPPDGTERSASEESEGSPQLNWFDRLTDRIDQWQRRIPPVAVVFAVTKKHGEDRGGQLAGLLAYKGFFSLFPLLLAFVNVLGLVLANNEDLRNDLIDSALSSIPVIGSDIQNGADAIGGNVAVVIGSVLVSLWAGLGLLDMLQESINTVWDVPMSGRPPFFVRRLRALPGAVLIGFCAALSGSSSWLTESAPAFLGDIAEFALPLLAGGLAFVGLHRLLSARRVRRRSLLPGAALCAVGWLVLYRLGSWYVDRIVTNSSDTYGVFVVVFGLLSWCLLLGTVFLYSNELSVVLTDRCWPRSLTGRNLSPIDQDALAVLATREVRVPGTDIRVRVPENPVPQKDTAADDRPARPQA